jgi:hypothetical protein
VPGPAADRRIVDRPEDHEAPGAWDWDPEARRRRDAAADAAARRFLLSGTTEEECWRCEAVPAAGRLGLCAPCHAELRSPGGATPR